MIRNLVKQALRRASLLDAAKVFLDSISSFWHSLRWAIRRKCGALDQGIIKTYFEQHAVKKLHIGCGGHIMDGWLNADYFPASREILHLDATKTFPFSDGAFDYVYCEHMIEHIPLCDGLRMLQECFRILKKGGVIRISTPNLAFVIDLFRRDKTAIQDAYIRWSTDHYIEDALGYNETYVVNHFVRGWGHQFIYDAKTLRRSLEKAGFAQLSECRLNESDVPELRNLEYEARMPPGFLRMETMTVEATKV